MKLDPLDILFSQFIRMRAIARVGGCERCLAGKVDYKQLQCSHFIGRRRKAVRWDPDNAAGLCAACHMYFTAHPLEHTEWFQERLGEGFDLLVARSNQIKPDKSAITIYLKEQLRRLNGGN